MSGLFGSPKAPPAPPPPPPPRPPNQLAAKQLGFAAIRAAPLNPRMAGYAQFLKTGPLGLNMKNLRAGTQSLIGGSR